MNVIECRELKKQYGSLEVLHGISFSAKENSCVGFLGPNGAGKTTTIRILAGLAQPGAGEVRVVGVDVSKNPTKVRESIGYLAQAPAFYNWMTGEEYLKFCCELFKIPARESKTRIGELLDLTGIKGAARRKIGGYSGGMKQRLGIAQALVNKPKVIFLDEPVSALDPIGRHEVLELIRNLKQHSTVFFSTHVLNDADQICDEVIILKEGQVALQAPVDELRLSYAQPVFEVELEHLPEHFLAKLESQSWYQSHQRAGSMLTIAVKDVKAAKQEIPQFLLSEGTVINRYQVQTPNLEQVFLQVVNNQ